MLMLIHGGVYVARSYILGVGDRHLENLVMQPDGHFFHLDFGYILGQPFSPSRCQGHLPIEIISPRK